MNPVSKTPQMYLAIDSGGTHTRGLLCNQNGQDIGSYAGPGANPKDIGWEAAIAIYRHCLQELLQGNTSTLDKICITAAGIGEVTSTTANWWAEQLGLKTEQVIILGDAISAQLGAFAGEDGIVVVAGTGTALVARQGQKLLRLGGWGHILGDQGSGYALGLAGLRQAVLDYDLGNNSALFEHMQRVYALETIQALLEHVHSHPKAEIARFARSVLDLAQNGHAHCQTIIDEQLVPLELLCKRFLALGFPAKLSYTGGLFQHEYYFNAFHKRLRQAGFSLQAPRITALEAAKQVALGNLQAIIL